MVWMCLVSVISLYFLSAYAGMMEYLLADTGLGAFLLFVVCTETVCTRSIEQQWKFRYLSAHTLVMTVIISTYAPACC
jgi:hypothetical protein